MPYKNSRKKSYKKYGVNKTPYTLGRKYKYKKKSKAPPSKYKKRTYKRKSKGTPYQNVKSKLSKSWFYPKTIIKEGQRKKTRKLLMKTEFSLMTAMLLYFTGTPTNQFIRAERMFQPQTTNLVTLQLMDILNNPISSTASFESASWTSSTDPLSMSIELP